MSKGLSGSTIKSWFQYRCERKTRYELMNPADLAAIPVAKDDREKPWAVLGVDYERRVVDRLARETGVLRPSLKDVALSEAAGAAFIGGRGSAEYAAQMSLKPRTSPRFLAKAQDIGVRRSFADLIRRQNVGSHTVFRMIDIKATRAARAFHKTQVAFYVRLLEAMIAEQGANAKIDNVGEIWRIPDDGDAGGDAWTADAFELGPYLRLVDDFCGEVLPTIAKAVVGPAKDETFFHVYFKCEQCTYLEHCTAAVDSRRPAAKRDISAVAGLSHEAKRRLNANGIRTVADLAAAGPGIGRVDGAGWSLSRKAEVLVARAKALRDNSVHRGADQHTFLMPPRCDATLYLVADHDPVDDALVSLGYLYAEGDVTRETIEILPTSSREAEANAIVRVFSRVIADLESIDARNAASAQTGSEPIYSHIFFYEPSESINLQGAVKRHLDDVRVRGGLLNMVRLFPPDDIVPEPEFRGMQHLPATALRSVFEQLFALPVTVSYDLRQVSQALAGATLIDQGYQPEPAFVRPFSSMLSIEISRDMREAKRTALGTDAVHQDVSARLATIRTLAEWLFAEHARRVAGGDGPMLRLNKRPFRLQATFNPLQAGDLDVLRAFELLENRSGLLDTLVRLAAPAQTRRDAGRAIGPMRLLSVTPKTRDALLIIGIPAEAMDVDISASALGLVLSDGEPDLILDPRLWPSLSCRMRAPRPGDSGTTIAVTVNRRTFDGQLFQSVMRRAGQDKWWLDQVFVDFNSPKADAYLSFLAAGSAT
jgi:hypothetical protein